MESKDTQGQVEHEATTSKISDEQLFYLRQRGINEEDAVSMIVHGFCKQVFSQAPYGVCSGSQSIIRINIRRKCRMSKSILKIDNLQAKIGDKQILKGLNLELEAGKVHAIMGPNGAGKSTLSKALVGHYDIEVTWWRQLPTKVKAS